MIGAINIALTGLTAATKQLSASASNIANVSTAGSLEDGKQAPYTPLRVSQTAVTGTDGTPQGVRSAYAARENPFTPSYDPDSPFADENGIIGVPNIDLAEEAVRSNLAEIQYKANIKTIQTASELSDELLRILDDEA